MCCCQEGRHPCASNNISDIQLFLTFCKIIRICSETPMTSGTTITSTHPSACFLFQMLTPSTAQIIFQASVVKILSSGIATSIIIHCCLSFRARVISGLLCCMRLSVIFVLSHISFTWSFSITGRGWCSYHFSPLSRPYLLLNSQWTLNSNLSWRVLYSLCANLVHPLPVCHTLSRHSLQSAQRLFSKRCLFLWGQTHL